MEPTYLIYSKPNCTYCEQAKALLISKNKNFDAIDIAADPSQRDVMFQQVIASGNPPPKTMPQIFCGDVYVGGFEELKARFKA